MQVELGFFHLFVINAQSTHLLAVSPGWCVAHQVSVHLGTRATKVDSNGKKKWKDAVLQDEVT